LDFQCVFRYFWIFLKIYQNMGQKLGSNNRHENYCDVNIACKQEKYCHCVNVANGQDKYYYCMNITYGHKNYCDYCLQAKEILSCINVAKG